MSMASILPFHVRRRGHNEFWFFRHGMATVDVKLKGGAPIR
jgi:mannose-6-phosphate isomerase-like protein (cupin superfamily)